MRSSSGSPPFSQFTNGMVAERPLLQIPTARLLAEENHPFPTLVQGSTPEISFVKEIVRINDQRLAEESSKGRELCARVDSFEAMFKHFIDEHWLPLQQAFFIFTHRECSCGLVSLAHCSCGRPCVAPASGRVSQTQYWLTAIPNICQEIRDIKINQNKLGGTKLSKP